MRIIRNRLLITLILVAATCGAWSTSSSAFSRMISTPDPIWVGAYDHLEDVDLNGEPEAGGGSGPAPGSGKTNRSGRGRDEAPASTGRDIQQWWTWMSRVWASRLWGSTF